MRINKKLIKKKVFNIENQIRLPYVSCKFDGRLGNNLFQIGCVLGYCSKYELKPVFTDWNYYDVFPKIKKYYNNDLYMKIKWNNYIETNSIYKSILKTNEIKMSGWFQSYKYFENINIINEYEFNYEIQLKIKNKYKDIIEKNTCGVHIRKTDYVENSYYEQLPNKYFEKSMSFLDSNIDYFLFFSDDINWCKNNFQSSKNIFIENEKDYEDLYLMTLCKNMIISNSSFSWWGAFLNQNKNKKIIYPERWSQWHSSTTDLVPKEWIKYENK